MELASDSHDRSRHIDQLKSLAFSVFMQCRRTLTHNAAVKSLTGFGPAAVYDAFLKPKEASVSGLTECKECLMPEEAWCVLTASLSFELSVRMFVSAFHSLSSPSMTVASLCTYIPPAH